jgi:tetratricopeptide (TPR) repeat protein
MQMIRPSCPSHRSHIALAALAGVILLLGAGCSHKSVEDDLQAGDQAMQNTRLADAEADYQDAAKAAPNDPRPHVALGNLYNFEQKPGPAQLEYMTALELDPKNPAAHAALGNVYSLQSQLSMAEAQYRAAVALDPAKATYRLSLGTTLQKQQKNRDAEAELLTAIGLEPKNAHAHLALANLLDSEPDRKSEAQAEFAQVKALDPSLIPGAATAAAPPSSPAAAPTTAGAAPTAPLKIRDLNRKFLLTHDSPVYDSASNNGRVLAQVHRGKWVHVTGLTGQWLRIQMRNGTTGFIPATTAE